ncbi:hypothetical protein [Streptomyces chryseus]|uniref:preATP grasp domain-containing protein n=1 Tax=Streptomyces chryseus TaxID=68186 RepID=UPI00110F8407|nr:hypothetical protein [Streptomyces chryseus]GGX44667.1 hypothetical protein GCM10010353_69400 [Streptomyces chryseus]
MPRLIIGNVTSEFMFSCALESFGTAGTHKQHAISTRTAWLLREGDALLTHRPLTPEFREYLGAASALDLSTITFLSADANDGAFLDHDTLLGEDLVERLRRLTGPDWQLLPYLHDRTIAELAERLGLSADSHPAFFAQGGADVFNSKAFFRIWADGLGVPVAPGRVCRSRAATARAVLELLRHTGAVIVKEDFSASGYGNLLFTYDPDIPALGASTTHHVTASATADDIAGLLADTFPAIAATRDFPPGLRPSETVVEAYYPHSRTLYSEVDVSRPPEEPTLLNHGDMRMEPVWNGFAIPPVDLPVQAEETMIHWSLVMARYLQTTGYRGYVNCDSILTPQGELLFNEVNARVGGCTHVDAAARRLLGEDYLRRVTVLTRNDLPCTDFAKLAWAIDNDPQLAPRGGATGALLLVDDAPYTGTVQYLVHGDTPHSAAQAEERLRRLAEDC